MLALVLKLSSVIAIHVIMSIVVELLFVLPNAWQWM